MNIFLLCIFVLFSSKNIQTFLDVNFKHIYFLFASQSQVNVDIGFGKLKLVNI